MKHPYFVNEGPLVMAHRGGRGLAPENTMIAFKQAVELGSDVLELDIRSTRDGVLVVIHDETIKRTTNGSGAVQDYSFTELQKFDAGDYWSNDGGETHAFRGKGHTIPSLEELFAAFPKLKFNIDIKQETPSIVKPFGELIRKMGLTKQVLVAAFDVSTIREFRQQFPEIVTAADVNEVRWFLGTSKVGLSALPRLKSKAFQLPEKDGKIQVISKGFVRAAHRRNMPVHVWTIDEEEDMQRLLDIGVDGLFTDRPDLMLKLLNRL